MTAKGERWTQGLAEYLASFSRREESSVVQSELAENGKLKPWPGSVLCKARVLQEYSVVCQTAGDWRPSSRSSVREPLGHHDCVHGPVLALDEPGDRNRY